MSQLARRGALFAVALGLVLDVCSVRALAQVAVTTYYAPAVVAPQPVVTYVPVRRGIFFPRIVYRPIVTYPVVAAPAPAAVTSYFRPAAPVIAGPVRAFFAPAPVTTYYPPAVPAAAPACCGQ